MLTWTPDNNADAYGCGLCGIFAQVLSPAIDADGALLFREDGTQVLVCDGQAAVDEIGGHMDEVHPYLRDDDGNQLLTGNGNPARAGVTDPRY